MSDITDTIVGLLQAEPTVAAIVADRVYPIMLPDGPTYPAIVVNKVAGVGEYDLSGDVGVEDARVQVDLYVETGKANLSALRLAVRRFLSAYQGAGIASGESGDTCAILLARVINEIDLTEVSTERAGPRLRRRTIDFAVLNREV